jgi:taurine dioxygenase
MIQIEPITPVIGAEITGADLQRIAQDSAGGESAAAKKEAARQIETIRAALSRYQVLFFRDQPELAPEVQVAFARQLGPLHYHPAAPHLEGHPEVFVIHTDRNSKIANGNGWHTDVSCDEEPPMATMLQLHTLPSCGGDTLFASMFEAFESLSTNMQTFLTTLSATHASEHIYRGRYKDRGVNDKDMVYPSSVHPVVRSHEQASRNALYVNPSFTTHINELNKPESDALLAMLYHHQQRTEFQVRFRWSPNAIALWDNRSTQHFAMWDYWPEERKGHRVTIKGKRPTYTSEIGNQTSSLRLSRQRLA